MHPVTLQINVAPPDYPRVRHTLPHQLRMLSEQCTETLIVVDAQNKLDPDQQRWNEQLEGMQQLISELQQHYPRVRCHEVDYQRSTNLMLSEFFYGKGIRMPEKDFRGGPFYSYYYAWFMSSHDYIFHLDADMLISGGSQTWVGEALAYLREDESLLGASPLSGPPILQGEMPRVKKKTYNALRTDPRGKQGYLHNDFSTRICLFDRTKLKGTCRRELPNFDHWLKALLRGKPPYRFPEGTLSDMMKRHGWYRLDFLGDNNGMWAYHPGYELVNYWKHIDQFIAAAEENKFPEAQRGYQNVQQAFVDAVLG